MLKVYSKMTKKLLQTPTEPQNSDAQYTLGWMYEQGRGFKQDLGEAQKWYHDGERHHATGSLYSIGRVCEY
jgi:TPR repeat protein